MATTEDIMEKEKKIGNYKINFKASFKKEDEDVISLLITYAEDLRVLLKSVCITSEPCLDFQVPNNSYRDELGEYHTVAAAMKRYRVKKWLVNSLYSNYKGLLFAKELIDNGKVEMKLATVGKVDEIVNEMKEAVGSAIYHIQKYEDFETTVTYDVKVKL